MTQMGGGILWATQVPVHGHFRANIVGPFIVAGAGGAFASSRSRSLASPASPSGRPGSLPDY